MLLMSLLQYGARTDMLRLRAHNRRRLEGWCVAAFMVLMTGCSSSPTHEPSVTERFDALHSRNGQRAVLDKDQVLDLIGASPKLERENFNPQALLSVANALICVGKDPAIDLLNQFIDSVHERASAGKCHYNEVTRVIPIALVLKEPSSGPFECVTGAWTYDGINLKQEPWSEFPLVTVDDIPFLAGLPSGGSTLEEVAVLIVGELKRSGMRDQPLRPHSLPTTACTKLLRSEKWSSLTRAAAHRRTVEYMEACIRQEALLALSAVYPVHVEFSSAASEGRPYGWEAHWAAVRTLRIGWDADLDAFCITP